MKNCRFIGSAFCALAVLFFAAIQMGCQSTGSGPGNVAAAAAAGKLSDQPGSTDTTYHAGDKIVIDFADNPGMPPSWQQVVREDGTVTLPLNQTITAEGKRKRELEEAIQKLYVPNILRRLTVNVRAEERTYFVRGEVKNPGQKVHTGSITALKAIGAAGDFTDFAKKSKVDIIRANGQTIHMNAKKALNNPAKYDVPVYPGDTVYVYRRFF